MKNLNRLASLALLAGLGFGLATQASAMSTALPGSLNGADETALRDLGCDPIWIGRFKNPLSRLISCTSSFEKPGRSFTNETGSARPSPCG